MYFLEVFTESINQILIHVFLGIVQGLTEFLPISSTAHLMVIPHVFGIEEPSLSVIASLQLGSMGAVIFYFWSDLKGIVNAFRYQPFNGNVINANKRLANAILIGTMPIVLVGIYIKFFWPYYEKSSLRSIPVIGFVSIIMAIFLLLSEFYGTRKKDLNQLNTTQAILVGFSQVLALIPGVSRSGVTITASLFTGLNRSSAAKFSFLLGIPAITLAGIVETKELIFTSQISLFLPLLFGLISSAITSFLAIDFLLKFLKTHSTRIFIYYRMIFGILVLLNWYK
tara:strand:+ start:319 stop:1167 length:849 start_codon:yes stop_codon:yes gene_type:complete